jgi:phospho-N-acetylmuramoyl-pentapeptide-transferase
MSLWLQLGYGFLFPLLLSLVFCRVMRKKLGWLKSSEKKAGKEKIHRLYPRPRRPLSGGLALLISLTLGLLVLNIANPGKPQPQLWAFLGIVWIFGLIGLADDLRKTAGQGLGEWEKLALQVLAALGFTLFLQQHLGFGPIHLPFVSQPVTLSPFLYPLLGTLVIVAAANAVNLTDGLDGLAGGQIAIAAIFLLIAGGFLQKPLGMEIFLGLFAVIIGFLVFNYPPARLLMGDMGSLSLGAALAAGSMLMGAELFLPVIGGVFVLNTLSVIIQIGAARRLGSVLRFPRQGTTEAFRPFLCTPLHHHFQWLGWPEKSILRLFWALGIIFGALGALGLIWGAAWVIGLILLPAPLLAAALQKLLRGSYFLGFSGNEGKSRLALFQGLPVAILGKSLYRPIRETSLSESALAPGIAEGMLWRPLSEIEARVALGSLYLQQHLTEEALGEWEEIPLRNLLLRESVVMQLARLYYSRDRLLEAIRLWEALPRTRLISMPNLQEIIRAARLRLGELASKSFRQAMGSFARLKMGEPLDGANLSRQLKLSLRYNQDLLTLLLGFPSGGEGLPEMGLSSQASYQQVERALRDRMKALQEALDWGERNVLSPAPAKKKSAPDRDAAQALSEQIKEWLGFSAGEIEQALAESCGGEAALQGFQPSPKASRNAIARLQLAWSPPESGPQSVVAKSFREERVRFASACFRREKALLGMLSGYGCPVPKLQAAVSQEGRDLLLLEDVGNITLAERLEGVDIPGKENLLAAAVTSLAALHYHAAFHLGELKAEVRKIDKEVLNGDYHMNAFRIALERLSEGLDAPRHEEAATLLERYEPVATALAGGPEAFIHFECTPHHLLLEADKLTIFDFEQGTLGPAEFDLACLLNSPEAALAENTVAALLALYQERAEQKLDSMIFLYADLAKSLTYAGAAWNFYGKFGGAYHLQRLEWYLNHALHLLTAHPSLRALRTKLRPWLRRAKERQQVLIEAAPGAEAPENEGGQEMASR